jgi:hypothetical protein
VWDGPGAVKGGYKGLDRGTKGQRMDRGQASIHVRMVMETVLTEVKTMIRRSQGRHASICALGNQGRVGHTSRSWRRHSSYLTQSGFGGLGLKTVGGRFAGFGPQNPGRISGWHVAPSESLHRDFIKGLQPSES